ncbi:MAG: tyrosine-type recombinase/integrase, partial [Acutalibacteraceae bacterium]|nr:tyrosine-type recombinase/integrase [Acutalibacteraceae bacterium]
MYYKKPKSSIFNRKKDKRWCCELTLGLDEITGKHINKYLYAKTKNGAEVRRDEFLEEWKENKPVEAQNDLIGQISRWLYNIKIKKVSEKTFDRYEQTFNYQIVPGILNTGINDINKFDVYAAQRVIDYNAEKGLSYSSVNKIKQLLNQFFDFALANNNVKMNPMSLTEIKKDTEIDLENDNDDDIYVFTQEEIEKIKAVCKTKYKNGKERFHQAEFFIFMLNTGIRAGEALATRYSDIDFNTGVYKINKTAVNVKERDKNGKSTNTRKRIIKTPKTKNSRRRMKLNPEILEIVKNLKSQEPEGY